MIGALNYVVKKSNLPYEEVVDRIKNNLFGIESEPATAALCITNMILRGDGKSGIIKADCFEKDEYPNREVDFVLMNPPFPHKKTDTPATDFIDRGLKSLKKRGILASIVPYSLLVNTSEWHKKILKNNTLHFVTTLPPDLFNPYAAYNTAVLMIEKGVPHGTKKVFVSKISNDGYKLKKNSRVKQSGSQLEIIRDAFQDKREIPEVCKLALIDSESLEWSPEAYIDNAPHSDESFIHGFEESIHKQAAFYISAGTKLTSRPIKGTLQLSANVFSPQSSISLQKVRMGEFKVEDYFDVVLGGKDEIEDLEEGNFPIVSTSEFMNGVTTWKKPRKIYDAPSITVATDGSTCSSFVQEFPFYAFYKVAILSPKAGKDVPVDALYYVAYLLKRERWRYVYARKFGKYRINQTKLYSPVDAKGNPDFELMAKIVQQANAFPVIKFFRECVLNNNK
ncbi:MAG: hypothetical protein A2787_01435 [Omnitrophica WOR_2 bacterium RIFCSPHIGHO2_01_FULL_48_9]|nr:MAG: hypothetical protein A2787_01435 [Omnitrophica WOR_2 bacterium RIFCSPHIGHO2_01_FULL_48_9]